jgi:hypothetical protein
MSPSERSLQLVLIIESKDDDNINVLISILNFTPKKHLFTTIANELKKKHNIR